MLSTYVNVAFFRLNLGLDAKSVPKTFRFLKAAGKLFTVQSITTERHLEYLQLSQHSVLLSSSKMLLISYIFYKNLQISRKTSIFYDY